jgi:alkylation response protein AidB-like acyl-CoA dehydrogenase
LSYLVHPGPIAYQTWDDDPRFSAGLEDLRVTLEGVAVYGEEAGCELLGKMGLLSVRDVARFPETLADVRRISRLAPALGHWVHQARAGAARFVAACADPEAAAAILAKVDAGEARCGVAISELGSGSSLRTMAAVAEPVDGGWRLRAEKCWIYRPDLVTHLIVLCRRADNGEQASFIVAAGEPGVELVPVGDFLSGEPYGDLHLDCEVPDGARVALPEADFFAAYALERLGGAAKLVGICEAALDVTIDRLRTREQGGRPIGDRQTMQMALGAAVERVAIATATVDGAARMLADPEGGARILDAATIAKVACSESASAVANFAVQVHGASGFRDDDFAGKLWRIARGYEIAGGTSEVLRSNLGRRILALPRT